jgi:PTS system mannose-specific IIA component
MSDPLEVQVGVVLCCHGEMGEGVRQAAEMIVGPQRQLATLGIHPGDGRDQLTAALTAAIEAVDEGAGALVLTDMAGGTPCNLVAGLPPGGKLEMVTGFNLPVLLRALRLRATVDDLGRLAEESAIYGAQHLTTLRSLLAESDEA